MVWNASLPADTSKIKLSANFIRQNWAAIEGVLGLSSLSSPAPYIPATHPVWFYSDVVPTGWTLVAIPGDSLIAIKGGAVYTTGGVLTGTWSGPPHTLTIPEMPPHTHRIDALLANFVGGNGSPDFFVKAALNAQSGSTGGGLPHQHDYTATRPQANVGILCSKNP